jgi:hypothetical protein
MQRVRQRQKHCRSVVGLSKEPPTTTTTEIRARPIEVAQSLRDEETSSAGIVRKIIILLMIVGSCRTRKKNGTYQPKNKSDGDGKASVDSSDSDGDALAIFLLHVFLEIMNGHLILLLHFIFVVTKTSSIRMSLCSLEILCVWEMILHVRLRALAPFRSRHMMG